MTTDIPAATLEKFTTFGDLLRFLRRRVGLTQMELAAAVGYSDAQISRLEQNLRLPDIPTIKNQFVLSTNPIYINNRCAQIFCRGRSDRQSSRHLLIKVR